MRQFALAGHRVFYLSEDFLLARPLAVTEIERNVYGLRLPANAAAKAFEGRLAENDVRGMADGVACLQAAGALRQTVAVVQHPFWTPLAEELQSRFGWPVVYDCMDDYAGLRRNVSGTLRVPSGNVAGTRSVPDTLSDLEDRLVRMADLTVATSERLLARVSPLARRIALVRNGVDYEHFAPVEPAPLVGDMPFALRADASPTRKRGQAAESLACASGWCDSNTASTVSDHKGCDVVVGYYGAIAHWFDARLVADLARQRPEWRFELVGNTFSSDLRPLAGLPNVRLLGEMPYAELPRRLARWHCCIIPFLRNELTEATNPVKVYEMLAAGMPVVAVDLPELRPIAAAGLIALADDATGFAWEIESLLASQSPAAVAARREFARQNTWHERFRELQAAMAPLERIRHTPCAVAGEPAAADGTRRVPDTKAA